MALKNDTQTMWLETPYGIKFQAAVYYVPEEKATTSSPGAPYEIDITPIYFTWEELAMAEFWLMEVTLPIESIHMEAEALACWCAERFLSLPEDE